MSLIAIVRHGSTEWNEAKRLQGQTDVPLSAKGREQVGRWRLPHDLTVDRWVASPLSRAQQTAEILGLAPAVEPALIEMDWGTWEGKSIHELRDIYGQEEIDRRTAKGLDLRPHEGESPREVRERVGAWAALQAEAGAPVGAVAHQGIIRALMSLATGWHMIGKPPHKLAWDAIHLFDAARDGSVEIVEVNVHLAEPLDGVE